MILEQVVRKDDGGSFHLKTCYKGFNQTNDFVAAAIGVIGTFRQHYTMHRPRISRKTLCNSGLSGKMADEAKNASVELSQAP